MKEERKINRRPPQSSLDHEPVVLAAAHTWGRSPAIFQYAGAKTSIAPMSAATEPEILVAFCFGPNAAALTGSFTRQ